MLLNFLRVNRYVTKKNLELTAMLLKKIEFYPHITKKFLRFTATWLFLFCSLTSSDPLFFILMAIYMHFEKIKNLYVTIFIFQFYIFTPSFF